MCLGPTLATYIENNVTKNYCSRPRRVINEYEIPA